MLLNETTCVQGRSGSRNRERPGIPAMLRKVKVPFAMYAACVRFKEYRHTCFFRPGPSALCRIISEKECCDHRKKHYDPIAYPCQDTVETGRISPGGATDSHSRNRIQNNSRDITEIHRGDNGISETEHGISDQRSQISDPGKYSDFPPHTVSHK